MTFRDAHAHLPQIGRAMAMIPLDRVHSPAECLDAIAHAADGLSNPDAWLLARSLRVESWQEPRYPTARELDAVSDCHPICAWSFDHHAIVANSAALQLAGIDHRTPDPPGGVICRDPQGLPTGLLLEAAAHLVWNAVPVPTPAERRRHLLDALDHMASLGYREVHDLHAPGWLGPLLASLQRENRLTLRVTIFPPLSAFDETLRTRSEWESHAIRLGGFKIFTDGTLNSRTAWMLAPFSDSLPGHPCGKPMMTPDQIDDAIRRADAAGLPIAAHAIGDAAVRAVLDAVQRSRPRSTTRVEHAEIIDEADVPRFASLGVVASVQPCHLLADVEALLRYLPHRLDRVLPLHELIDSGALPGELLIFGSDAPIVRADPADSILAATRRARPDSRPIAPAQAITGHECRLAFAANPA